MNIYGLKGLIEAIKKENKPGNKFMLQFYEDLYNNQLQEIADQVTDKLDEEQKKDLYYKSKAWNEYLAK